MIERGLYFIACQVSGVKLWAVRRLTAAGWLAVAALFLTTLFSMPIRLSVAYQTSTLLGSLLLVALAASTWTRGRFWARRALPRFGSVNERLVYHCEVRNLSARRQTRLGVVELRSAPRLTFPEFKFKLRGRARGRRPSSFRLRATAEPQLNAASRPVPVPELGPGETARVQMDLRPARRGVLRFSGVAVTRAEPFGFFRSLWPMDLPEKIVILPKRYPVAEVPLPGTPKYQLGGLAQASSVGESQEFVSLREYRRGDPLRHIHWKSWARTGRLIVKEFEDEFFVRHALVLDTFTEGRDPEVFEEAVSVAASFACTLPTQESLLDLLFVESRAYCFTAGRSLAHSEQLLEILASVQPSETQTFEVLQNLVLRHLKLVTGCIAIFTAWDSEREVLVRRIRALGVPLLVFVVVAPGELETLTARALQSDPNAFRPLEVGRIAAGLSHL
jgi:uncharacterized protein (DUF58 family)